MKTTKAEECFKYIEHLRHNGRTVVETRELLAKTDYSTRTIEAAIRKAKRFSLVRVLPGFVSKTPEIEPLM